MAGNVWEWVNDYYRSTYYDTLFQSGKVTKTLRDLTLS
jgi:formylglycine-generating enzyme required for sulfatase activity